MPYPYTGMFCWVIDCCFGWFQSLIPGPPFAFGGIIVILAMLVATFMPVSPNSSSSSSVSQSDDESVRLESSPSPPLPSPLLGMYLCSHRYMLVIDTWTAECIAHLCWKHTLLKYIYKWEMSMSILKNWSCGFRYSIYYFKVTRGPPSSLQISNTRRPPMTSFRRPSNFDSVYAVQLKYCLDLNGAGSSVPAVDRDFPGSNPTHRIFLFIFRLSNVRVS